MLVCYILKYSLILYVNSYLPNTIPIGPIKDVKRPSPPLLKKTHNSPYFIVRREWIAMTANDANDVQFWIVIFF